MTTAVTPPSSRRISSREDTLVRSSRAFGLGGILPMCMFQETPGPVLESEGVPEVEPNFVRLMDTTDIVGTGGSGGTLSRHAVDRMVGAGAGTVRMDNNDDASAAAVLWSVPGRQTVPRVEAGLFSVCSGYGMAICR